MPASRIANGLLQLDDRESAHCLSGARIRAIGDNSEAVAVVLDDRKDRAVADGCCDGRHVLSKVRRFDLDPRIEAGVS